MAFTNSWMIVATLGFFHVMANLLLTKDVFDHFAYRKDRILLYVLIWAMPFAGAFYVFRKIGLEHYKTHESSNTGLSLGLLGMDEIFNPSAKPKYSLEQTREVSDEITAILDPCWPWARPKVGLDELCPESAVIELKIFRNFKTQNVI